MLRTHSRRSEEPTRAHWAASGPGCRAQETDFSSDQVWKILAWEDPVTCLAVHQKHSWFFCRHPPGKQGCLEKLHAIGRSGSEPIPHSRAGYPFRGNELCTRRKERVSAHSSSTVLAPEVSEPQWIRTHHICLSKLL